MHPETYKKIRSLYYTLLTSFLLHGAILFIVALIFNVSVDLTLSPSITLEHQIASILGVCTLAYSCYVNHLFSKKRALTIMKKATNNAESSAPVYIFHNFMVKRLAVGELAQLTGLGLILFQQLSKKSLTATDLYVYLLLLGISLSIKRFSKPKESDLIELVDTFNNRR
jgi:archaellum biogenesis protein FlaJ (TadC family)